jgi:hypothetical protein
LIGLHASSQPQPQQDNSNHLMRMAADMAWSGCQCAGIPCHHLSQVQPTTPAWPLKATQGLSQRRQLRDASELIGCFCPSLSAAHMHSTNRHHQPPTAAAAAEPSALRLPLGDGGDETLLVSLPERPFSALTKLPADLVSSLLAQAGGWAHVLGGWGGQAAA